MSQDDSSPEDQKMALAKQASSGPMPAVISEIFKGIAKQDWLQIPGATRAIFKLVAGVGNAGSAWIDIATAAGEQRADAIRSTTEARRNVMQGLPVPALSAAINDPALLGRAVDHLVVEQFAKQANREAVAREAVMLLNENLSATGEDADEQVSSEAGPADDWLNVFSNYAEKATSERLQLHWAAILAGEIRKPGTFSFAALQVMSIMDPRLAANIAKQSSRRMHDGIIQTECNKRGQEYTDLIALQALGLVSLNHNRIYPPIDESFVNYEVGGSILYVSWSGEIQVPATIITPVGLEIMSIIPPSPDRAFAEEVVEAYVAAGASWAQLDTPRAGN